MEFKKESFIGYWCTHLGFTFRAKLDAQTKTLGISATDAMLLLLVHTHGSSSLSKLAKHIHNAHPSVIRNLDAMESGGYLKRDNDPNDRRKKTVTLTNRGRKLVPRIMSIITAVNKDALKDFNQEESELLFGFMRRIALNLGADFLIADDGS